jgi:CRP/FNR family transcriptional regulator, cyclic AMP receptor protein
VYSVGDTKLAGAKGLRGLDGDQRTAVWGCDHDSTCVDRLDRVGNRDARYRPIGSGEHGLDHRPVQIGSRERPGCVVHTHDVGVVWHPTKSSADAFASGLTTSHATFSIDITERNDDDDAVGNRLGDTPRTVDHALITEQLILLGSTEPLTGTAANHDGPHLWSGIHPAEGSTVPGWMADQIERLSKTSFFADAPPELLGRIAAAGRERQLVRGDVLFNEGDAPDALYLVGRGRIAIAMTSPIDKRESVVALMEAGDLFGELGLLDEGSRSAMARALEPSDVLEIPYDPVRQLFDEDPRLLWNVTRLLAGRLRVMDEVLADSVFLDVTGRTAKRLLELAAGADEFQLPVTQEELAGMVGASRERVNKAISSFIRLGWLEQQERTYRIVHRDRLELRAR